MKFVDSIHAEVRNWPSFCAVSPARVPIWRIWNRRRRAWCTGADHRPGHRSRVRADSRRQAAAGVNRDASLSQNFGDYACWKLVSKPLLESVAFVHQVPEIQSQQVQHRGMEVMNTDTVLHSPMPHLVCGAVNITCFHPATRHPDAEPARSV